MCFGSCFVIEAIYLTFSKYGFILFVTDTNVIDIGVEILNMIVPFYFTYIFIEILSGAIRGTGKSLVPTLITVFGICVLRVVWLAIVPQIYGSIGSVMVCYPITWIVTSLAFYFYYKFGNIYGNAQK